MVIDPLAYFGRFAFEYSDRGTKQDGPLIEDPDEEQEAGDSNATGCQCPSCAANPSQVRHDRFQGFHSLYPDEDEPPKDELFFFLCAQRVFAFILKSRTWGKLHWGSDSSPERSTDTCLSYRNRLCQEPRRCYGISECLPSSGPPRRREIHLEGNILFLCQSPSNVPRA